MNTPVASLNLQLSIEPDAPAIERELEREMKSEIGGVMKDIAQLALQYMREAMNESSPSGRQYKRRSGEGFTRSHRASAKGQPPAIDTYTLYRSIRGRQTGETEAEIEMADHAYYLDPLFDGEPDGGGYLNRPFIEPAIEKAIARERRAL